MTVPFTRDSVRLSTAARAEARTTIAILMETVGAGGLAAARAEPGLLALVDQHAAAVRDSLDGDRRQLTLVRLAGYADGVRSAAVEHGWLSPADPWTEPDWVLLRLLAVCALVESLASSR